MLAAAAALGPAATLSATEATPRYAVEVILFENVDQSRTTAELPAPEIFSTASGESPLETAARDAQPVTPRVHRGARPEFLLLEPYAGQADFLPLAADDMELGNTVGRLERLDAYAPLVHAGWSQRARPGQVADARDIAARLASGADLSGQITLYKDRFVHLRVELELTERVASERVEPIRLIQSRRLRGQALHYFDHPRFGLLASVREIESGEEPADDADQ